MTICGCKSLVKSGQKDNGEQDWVNFLFQDYMGNKPSASFVVIKDGEIKDCESFGYADLENKISANRETNYRLGSVTKQFTAMGVLVLIDQGKLSYHTKLKDIIPEFPDYGESITIIDLLAHRSGLQKYTKLYARNSEKQLVDKDVLDLLIRQDSLLFSANSKYKYSNSGYAVLALIIERISGRTFKDFMDKEIFEKVGMKNSTVYLKDLQIVNRALGYEFNDSIYNNKDQNVWSAIQGDGGIYSSISDYQKWDASLYDELLIKAELREDAFSNWDENGKNEKAGYGFGWHIKIRDETKHLIHGGSTTGFRNSVIRIPSEKITVAIYTNSTENGPRALERKALFLASLYSENKVPMPIEIMIDKEISINGSKDIEKYYRKLTSTQKYYEISELELTSLGLRHLQKNRDDHALNVFRLIEAQFPNYFGGYYGLGRYYQSKGEKQKAILNYKKVVNLAPIENQNWIDAAKKRIDKLNE